MGGEEWAWEVKNGHRRRMDMGGEEWTWEVKNGHGR